MADKPENAPEETKSNSVRNLLLASITGVPDLNRRTTEVLQSALVPLLILNQPAQKYTEDQQKALRFYQGTVFTRNKPGLDLVRENIVLDGALDDSARIAAVKLTDDEYVMTVGPSAGRKIVGSKSALTAFLVFHRGYKGGTGDDAPYDREGFRLWMKKEGFDIPDGGITKLEDIKAAGKKGLTDDEQFKLDCLTIRSLCDARHRIGGRDGKALVLSKLEREILDEAMERFTKRLGLDKPEDFPKKFAELYKALAPTDQYDGDGKTDRQTLMAALKAALNYEGTKTKVADAVDKWMESKDADGADLKKKWIDAMAAMPDVKARRDFQDFIVAFFDEKLPRAGAQLGLNKALRDPSTRDKAGELTDNRDSKTVAGLITKEALDLKDKKDKEKK